MTNQHYNQDSQFDPRVVVDHDTMATTLEAAAERFLAWLAATPDLGSATKRAYLTDFRQFRETMVRFHPIRVADLDERHIEDWKATLDGLTPSTIRRKLVSVSQFFEWARRERLVVLNPVDFVKKPRKRRRVQQSLSLEHYDALLAACRSVAERAILGCLFWGGCRRQEVVDLDVGHVDLDRGNLFVKGKGQHERLLPLPRNLRRLLVDHLQHRGSVAPCGPLFVNRNGRRISTKSVNSWFRRLTKEAGLQHQGYTPHACRRGIGQLMDEQGFSTFATQAFMGHEDPKTTAGYVQATAQSLQGKMDANPIFGDDEVKTSETSEEIKALQATVDQMAATLNAFVERFSPGLDENVYPIGHPPQPGDAVGHER